MTEYQISAKYPDGTIVVAKGEVDADSLVGSFMNLKLAYESESGASPIKPFIAADPVMAQAIAAAAPLTQPQPTSAPPGVNGRLPDGQLHPTKICQVCGQPMKAKDWLSKDGKRCYKLECSQTYEHKPHDWSQNYK